MLFIRSTYSGKVTSTASAVSIVVVPLTAIPSRLSAMTILWSSRPSKYPAFGLDGCIISPSGNSSTFTEASASTNCPIIKALCGLAANPSKALLLSTSVTYYTVGSFPTIGLYLAEVWLNITVFVAFAAIIVALKTVISLAED